MHIGRATPVPPEVVQHHEEVLPPAPVEMTHRSVDAVARSSAPDGEGNSPTPTFHPVSDLIQRLALTVPDPATVPPKVAAQVYRGTPPASAVLDMQA